ncbi:immunoglobulin alpha Fc receptor [Peromyscus eremicus]|uniref:immunoglobulin alpha Fc receptor n=1 Tax=Peromyscus eremicus TaxID=42410 RepID=UPI0027DC50A8|nr:immunoglobulin alpha Fc receptor [Peromyscus eremicus]
MAPQDTTFLCLGEFPIPTISAATSPVVPWNGSVRILCRGIPEAFLYQLSLMKNSTHTVIEKKLGLQKEAEFIINHMNTTMAGGYQCQYKTKYHWSEQSKPLEVVVTGLYDKPVLSTDQSLALIPGENISFQCSSAHTLFSRFSLAKEGDTSSPRHQHEEYQGNFSLGPVSAGFSGNYRCYGWHSSSPHVWSAPSNALEIIVTDSSKQDSMMENSIRMGMAGLVLVVLLVILAEDWNSHRVSHKEDFQELAVQRWSKYPMVIGVGAHPPHPVHLPHPLDSVHAKTHTWFSIGLASGMPSTLTALLCLQLCLSQRINTEKQNLPKPIIWAQPSTRVTKGTPVYIWCQGPKSASEYQLYFRGSIWALKRPESHRSRSKVNFFIPQMTLHTAGEYTCFYQSGELQSEPSDPLVLVVTGLYDTPKLQVHPGHEVTLGENVTFFCHLVAGTSKFFLVKEGRSNHVQQRYGKGQAEFPMGPMTRAHRGTYRCFGSYSDYTWSFPNIEESVLRVDKLDVMRRTLISIY